MKIKILFLSSLLFATFCLNSYADEDYNILSEKFLAHFPNDYRGIIHCHSNLSRDSRGKFGDIDKAAEKRNIDFIVMTDHWSQGLFQKSRRGFYGQTLFIKGAEISKKEGLTMLSMPLPENFEPSENWEENISKLRNLNSLALADHIEFSKDSQLTKTDGIEITNLHAHVLQKNIWHLVLEYFEVFYPPNWDLAFLFRDVDNLDRWYKLERESGRLMPAFAGNDTHDNYKLFGFFGPNLASYERTFRIITTHVWAEELTEHAIIQSLKAGHSYFAFEIFGKVSGFHFYAVDDKIIFLPGNILKFKENLKLAVKAPPLEAAEAEKVEIRIIKDGVLLKKSRGLIMVLDIEGPGIYHAEVWKNKKPWIFSNAIVVKY